MYVEPITAHDLPPYWNAIADGKGVSVIPSFALPDWREICSELHWDAFLLNDGFFRERTLGFPGVYRLINLASDFKLAEVQPLNRVCGVDPTGTIYIGCAKRLHERLNSLRRSLRKHNPEHSHGVADALASLSILPFTADKMGVAIRRTPFSMRKWVEGDCIASYMKTFGDTPPLNYTRK